MVGPADPGSGGRTRGPRAGSPPGAPATAALGPLTAQRLRLTGWDSNGANDSTGLLRIGHLARGRFPVRSDRTEVTGGPVSLFPTGPCTAQWEDRGLSTLTVDAAVVEDCARAVTGRTDLRLELTGHHPRTDGPAKYWRATARRVVEHVLVDDGAGAGPLLLDRSVRGLVTAAPQTFPSIFLEACSDPDPPEQAHPAALRRGGPGTTSQ